MPYALLSMIWTSVAFYLVTVLSGLHFWGNDSFLRSHIASALTATVLLLFAHTMVMFYFIGTGKKIKEFTATWDEATQNSFRQRIILQKRKLFPHMTMICIFIVVVFVLGGALSANLISKTTHGWFALGIFVYTIHVSVLETIHLFKNIDLITEVNQISRERELARRA